MRFFRFRLGIPFLGKLVPKNQNCQFKLKFGTSINLNMKNSMALFTFSVLERKYPFTGKFGSKNETCQFKLKFGTKNNSNMQNLMMMFNFFCFGSKTHFWTNLVQKIKIVSLSWNLVRRLIRICRVEWWHSLFLFLTGNTLFGQIWSKKSKFSV